MSKDRASFEDMFASLPTSVQEKALRTALRSAEASERFSTDSEETKAKLAELFQRFSEHHKFQPGQFVKWKEGLSNRRRPAEGEPALVMEVLQEPVFDPKDPNAASPFFREPLDLVLGILDEDGEFLLYHFDSRRFEPFEEPRVAPKRKERSAKS